MEGLPRLQDSPTSGPPATPAALLTPEASPASSMHHPTWPGRFAKASSLLCSPGRRSGPL
jgi:hypothetical protein